MFLQNSLTKTLFFEILKFSFITWEHSHLVTKKKKLAHQKITFSILDNYFNNTSHSSLTTLFKYSFLILSLLFVPNSHFLFLFFSTKWNKICIFNFYIYSDHLYLDDIVPMCTNLNNNTWSIVIVFLVIFYYKII